MRSRRLINCLGLSYLMISTHALIKDQKYCTSFLSSRVDSVGGCYETGFVQNSRINYISTKKGPCPSGPLKTATWHNVTVYVKGDQVSILLDGERIISTKGHFPTR